MRNSGAHSNPRTPQLDGRNEDDDDDSMPTKKANSSSKKNVKQIKWFFVIKKNVIFQKYLAAVTLATYWLSFGQTHRRRILFKGVLRRTSKCPETEVVQ